MDSEKKKLGDVNKKGRDNNILLGNGCKIRFLRDSWVGGVTLQLAFPRIYALALNKDGRVNEYGF